MKPGMSAAHKRLGVQKFVNQPCPRCGAPESVINGRWLRLEREGAGLTLREFATRLGFSAVYLSDIERGQRACTLAIRQAYEGLRRAAKP